MITDNKMVLVLILGVLIVAWTMYKFHRDNERPEFDLTDLLIENGKVSKIAIAFFVALGVTTWVIIDLQIAGKLTEGYYIAYGGMWVAPLVSRVLFGRPPAASIPPTPTLPVPRTAPVSEAIR